MRADDRLADNSDKSLSLANLAIVAHARCDVCGIERLANISFLALASGPSSVGATRLIAQKAQPRAQRSAFEPT